MLLSLITYALVEYAAVKDDGTTVLDRSPPIQPFVTGMDFSFSIDAITGEFVTTPLDLTTIKTHSSFSPTRKEIFSLNYYSDVRELCNSRELGYSASITAPVEGVEVAANNGIDFSSSTTESASTLIIILNWELSDETIVMDVSNLAFSQAAKQALQKDSKTWRDTFGDYFLYGYGGTKRFTAVW